jgi:hypothetical protein
MAEMSEAKTLKERYETDLKELQAHCEHAQTHWAIEAWAPAHFTGQEIEVCDNCWKQLTKRPRVLSVLPKGKLVARKQV